MLPETLHRLEGQARRSGMSLVASYLALPPEALPDSKRPNEDGGATPDFPHPEGWPVYRVLKKCPIHGTTTRRASWSPQYDDDPVRVEPCDACRDKQDAFRRERERKIAEEARRDERRQATGERSRRSRDPLDL